MKLLSVALSMTLVGAHAMAYESQFQQQSEAESEARMQQYRDRADARFMEESEAIGAKLAALNNTTASFNPNARTSPAKSGLFEDIVAGEWILGNGGVCIRTVWSKQVVCRGAQGFSLRPTTESQQRSKKHSNR